MFASPRGLSPRSTCIAWKKFEHFLPGSSVRAAPTIVTLSEDWQHRIERSTHEGRGRCHSEGCKDGACLLGKF